MGAAEKDPSKPPACLRVVFNRNIKISSPNYNIVLAEEADPLTSQADYQDLLSFESDIAQVVGVILLFAESPGSLAELGAFSAIDTIAPSLLAVLNDNYYEQKSFITRGPIMHLEKSFGEDSVVSLDCADLNIGSKGEIDRIDVPAFMESVVSIVKAKLEKRHFYNSLDPQSSGHRILILVGLCQEYGALTIKELRSYFDSLSLDGSRINNYLYCANLLGWIKTIRKGNHIFYVAKVSNLVLDYALKAGVSPRERLRWRSNIRDYWNKNDRPRSNAIRDVISAMAVP